MNRTILIVICDFLLVSLLAFSTVDINKVAEEGAPRQVNLEIATNAPASGKDLTAVMQVALEDERRNRDRLLGELSRARDTVGQQQSLLAEREKQVQNFQQSLETKEQQAARLQQEQAGLQDRLGAAQTNIQSLSQQLQATAADASVSKEKIAAMEAELRKQAQQAAAMQDQISQLAKSNQVVQAEKQQLNTQLQVAEVEKRHATEQVAKMEEQVKAEREEKTKLAEGVKSLATKSSELEREIRESRPLAPNAIFSEFLTNRVQAEINAMRSSLLGGSTKRRDTQTVLVTNGTNTFALCHVQDTPFTLSNPGTEWEGLSGTLVHGTVSVPIRTISFSLQDPRIVIVPMTADQARQLGCKVYRLSNDPFKFQDAVLIGSTDNYYGECRFEIDPTTPGYFKLDTSFLRGLFGKFNPSRGDLVFSKTGELLGVMANSTYCLRVQSFDGAATFRFAQDVRDQRTGVILSLLYSTVMELPFKLQ